VKENLNVSSKADAK
jgi:hypothetical protein